MTISIYQTKLTLNTRIYVCDNMCCEDSQDVEENIDRLPPGNTELFPLTIYESKGRNCHLRTLYRLQKMLDISCHPLSDHKWNVFAISMLEMSDLFVLISIEYKDFDASVCVMNYFPQYKLPPPQSHKPISTLSLFSLRMF